MQNGSSDELPPGRNGGFRGPRRARPERVEITFWTSFEKREAVRAIRDAHDRTIKSLMNEAADLLIAKYRRS